MSAQAVGANSICIIVPCHRVVGKTDRQADRLWWGNRKQKATTIAWKDRKREVLIFLSFEKTKKICCVL